MAEIEDNVAIRPLDAADAQAYRALRLQALLQAPEAFGASYAEEAARPLAAFIERITPAPPSLVFGAFADTELVGVAGFLTGISEKSRHRGTLWGVYLAPAWRGRGVARALVEAVVQHAAQHVLVLQARAVTTNSVALRLYERLGFRPYGIESKALRIDGAFFDEALLALDFSEAERG
ncbi:Protein N-acetyltransferase, RimJ/RimL family [Bosea sp. OK403]|uniref:GNAT family N-acetyltransferase n=1 Tax=Bosea sp. OK403 TaxID=1855286 RepID=UPI0008E2570E|nr:GNAT family protein [Bosea sp. OK403]SFI32483.1 Protein N-acetyltransferase, RimJ/RimL family [Bosea sp. OK403]